MTFYCITLPEDEPRSRLLQKACAVKNIPYVNITHKGIDVTRLPRLDDGDILYRASSADQHTGLRTIERLLLHENVITVYRSLERAYAEYTPSYIVHQKNDIPTPRTVSYLTPNRQVLRDQVEDVGGFPVVVKATGHSKGVGVIKVESFASLFSLVDYLYDQRTAMIMREYIFLPPPVYSYRAVVVGDSVAVVYRNESVEQDDFRSNVNQDNRRREVVDIRPEYADLLVRAVKLCSVDVGGVDFVISKENGDERLVLFESNCPFNFVSVVEDLGIPVHEIIVDFLLDKRSKRL